MNFYLYFLSVPELSQKHLVHGEGASFIRADVVGSSHGLAGLHSSNQILIVQHFLDGKGQGHGD